MVAAEGLVHEFISEDDLQTFEGWLRYLRIPAIVIAQSDGS